MSVLGALTIKITGDTTQFNKDIASVQNQLNKQTKGLMTVAKNMTTVGDSLTKGVTLPLLAVGAGLFKMGTEFDDAYDKIRIDTGKTGKEFEKLQKNFKNVAKDSASSFEEISEAVSGYNRLLGLADKPLEDLSKQVLNLSRITKTDLNANVETSAKLFNNWKIATQDQSKTLDLMYRASQQTGSIVTDLMAKVTDAGPIFRALGFDVETTTALIAGLNKAGIDSNTVIPAMKKSLVEMAKQGFTDPQEVLSMYVDKIKNAGSSIEATEIAAELFGARGGAQMAQVIREGRLNLDDLITSLTTGKESINGVADETDDWKEKLIKLKNEALVNLEPLANKVFDSVTRSVEKVSPKIEELTEWFGNLNPEMQDNIIKWSLILAAIGPALSIIGRMTATVIQLRNAFALLNAVTVTGFAGKMLSLLPQIALATGLVTLQVEDMKQSWYSNEEALEKFKAASGGFFSFFSPNFSDVTRAMDNFSNQSIKQGLIKAFMDGQLSAEAFGAAIIDLSGYQKVLHNDVNYLNIATKEEAEIIKDITLGTYELNSAKDEQLSTEERGKAIIDEMTASLVEQGYTQEKAIELATASAQSMGYFADETDGASGAVDSLYTSLYNLYLINADAEEKVRALKDGVKEAAEAIKQYGIDSEETKIKQEDYIRLLDSEITNTLPELIAKKGELTQGEKDLLVELLNGIETGEKWGITLRGEATNTKNEILNAINENINPTLDGMQAKLMVMAGTTVAPKIALDATAFWNTLNQVQSALNNVNSTATFMGFKNGGIAGFSEGGFLNKIISASAGVNLPSFDKGGMLAVLHPPELVLNGEQALQALWNMANQPIKSGKASGINIEEMNITSPKPLTESEITRQIDLLSRDLGYRMGMN